jgi:hypothetical protein
MSNLDDRSHILSDHNYGTLLAPTTMCQQHFVLISVGRQGLEPWTYGLKARSSTD